MRTRGRWAAIGFAVVLIAVVELLSDTLLDERLPFPLDTVIVTATVLLVAIVSSRLAFRSIDRLSATLQSRNSQLEASSASARALHQVTIAVAALQHVDQIFAATVEHARVLLLSDAAALALMGADGRLHVVATSGPADAFRSRADSTEDAAALFDTGLQGALLASPLQHGSQTMGVLAVASHSAQSYGVDAVETLGSLASQAAIALEQDRVQRQLRELAVRRERERIARDLHDGIAQVLGYVNTKTQAIDHLLDGGRVPEARGHVRELGAASRSVYVDVRTAIGRLASVGGTEDTWSGELASTVARLAETSKVAASYRVEPRAETVTLPSDTRQQLVSVVCEALTNVHKHADAARVEVTVSVVRDALVIRISDDGRGFDPAAINDDAASAWPRYGLRAMRERAASIGASIEWQSGAGRGTEVKLLLPLAPSLATQATLAAVGAR